MHFTDWGGPLHTFALHSGAIFQQLAAWLHQLDSLIATSHMQDSLIAHAQDSLIAR
jgi:hypothetical protein